MVCAVKEFFKRTPGWIIGWFKRNAANWAKQLYVAAILLYSIWIIWQVISGTAFIPQSTDPTLIQLDFLQAMAFLVAWSALVITITAKAVTTSKDFESRIAETSSYVENNRSRMETIEEKNQQFLSRVGRAEVVLLPKIDALTQENEQLRKQLGMREPPDDHVQ